MNKLSNINIFIGKYMIKFFYEKIPKLIND